MILDSLVRRMLGKIARVRTRNANRMIDAICQRNLIYYPELRLSYLANAKSGTSTILSSLWAAVDGKLGQQTRSNNPRQRDKTPGLRIQHGLFEKVEPDEVLSSVFFSVVRHPLVRLVSGYLDKIAATRPNPRNNVWKYVVRRHRLPLDEELSFPQFVDLLVGETPLETEKHFRPQTLNIAYGFIPHAHVGQLENLTAMADFLHLHGVPTIESFRHHATGAADFLDQFYADRDTLKKAVAFYAADFTNFNYEPTHRSVFPHGPVTPVPGDRQAVAAALAVLRDRALGPRRDRR